MLEVNLILNVPLVVFVNKSSFMKDVLVTFNKKILIVFHDQYIECFFQANNLFKKERIAKIKILY